jgi:hypothetical protein
MFGTTCYFNSRVPSNSELDNCPHIIMTNNEIWDATSLKTSHSSSEEEEYNGLVSTVTINREIMDCNPNDTQIKHDANESNIIRASVSATLTIETMLRRILEKVQVATYLPQEQDRKVAVVGSKRRHSQVTAEELAKKWIIGIKMA